MHRRDNLPSGDTDGDELRDAGHLTGRSGQKRTADAATHRSGYRSLDGPPTVPDPYGMADDFYDEAIGEYRDANRGGFLRRSGENDRREQGPTREPIRDRKPKSMDCASPVRPRRKR